MHTRARFRHGDIATIYGHLSHVWTQRKIVRIEFKVSRINLIKLWPKRKSCDKFFFGFCNFKLWHWLSFTGDLLNPILFGGSMLERFFFEICDVNMHAENDFETLKMSTKNDWSIREGCFSCRELLSSKTFIF